jgi:hypothetical protein
VTNGESPSLAVVRVVVAGGPFVENEILSLAFGDPTLARVASHRVASEPAANEPFAYAVPEVVSASVLAGDGPYVAGDVLTLAFVDSKCARIFRPPSVTTSPSPVVLAHVVALETMPPASIVTPPARGVAARKRNGALCLSLRWTPEDARRFIAMTDKLFTVERLGWYRHSLAARLLVADAVSLSDAGASLEANAQLETLRSCASEALGAPLLSVFMPHFTVDKAWLASLEPASLHSAIAGLRATLVPYLEERSTLETTDTAFLSGTIARDEWDLVPVSSVEAFLALLIPQRAADANVSQRVGEYRAALIELFGQTAQSSSTVRLKAMTTANHVLDERLWNLAGALQDACGASVA